MNREEKKTLRNKILTIRNSLDKNEKELMDISIYNKLINLDLYKKAKSIFIYISFSNEIDTVKIINKALEYGKEVYIPKIYREDKSMKAIRMNSFDELEKNFMGILEPVNDSNYIEKENIDLIIVPGVVFDKEGNRIGYGGGYYDRYLSDIKDKKNKVVLSYGLQIIDEIEPEIHDIQVDYIISESYLVKI